MSVTASEGRQRLFPLIEQHELGGRDGKVLTRVNRLIREAARDPASGTGKPERSSGDRSGCWSRRIDQEHRLVYTVEGDRLVVLQARFHH